MKLHEILEGLKNQSKRVLSKTITLCESTRDEDQELILKILEKLRSEKFFLDRSKQSKVLAFSGTPGVGKSSFLEYFGLTLLKKNPKNQIGMLLIDPASVLNKGAVLGDKTRMVRLAREENVFLRPSSTLGELGGVSVSTWLSLMMMMAFGQDYIIIETVGVGQSEVLASEMCDFFILLMQPGSGDDLQALKRGTLEVADLICLTKADGELKNLAKEASHHLSYHLPINEKLNKRAEVLLTSSKNQQGAQEVLAQVNDFFLKDFQDILKRRSDQAKHMMMHYYLRRIEKRMRELMQVENENKITATNQDSDGLLGAGLDYLKKCQDKLGQ